LHNQLEARYASYYTSALESEFLIAQETLKCSKIQERAVERAKEKMNIQFPSFKHSNPSIFSLIHWDFPYTLF
jgi:hypothetical protein